MIVQTPPVLIQHDDGRWYLEVLMPGGQESVLAPVGDGAWLFQQLSEKLIVPALRRDDADFSVWLQSRRLYEERVFEDFNQPYEG